MKIERAWYYVAPGKHVVHFRDECASYKLSAGETERNRINKGAFYFPKPRGKTLCDHCQAIEKRVRRARVE